MELSPDFAFQPLPALENEITQPFPQVASPLGPLAPLVGTWSRPGLQRHLAAQSHARVKIVFSSST